MSDLPDLARLLREHHRITAEIAALTGRPAERGHLGEFIAAAIFDIALAEGANQRGSDGVFRSGPLAGRSVNIKWYGVNERILDLAPLDPPDYYLVLTGPAASGGSSRGSTRPLTIEHVYLFESQALLAELAGLGVTIGTATGVRQHLWAAAEIYPAPGSALALAEGQREQLALFQIS